jgi:hypothetical protein
LNATCCAMVVRCPVDLRVLGWRFRRRGYSRRCVSSAPAGSLRQRPRHGHQSTLHSEPCPWPLLRSPSLYGATPHWLGLFADLPPPTPTQTSVAKRRGLSVRPPTVANEPATSKAAPAGVGAKKAAVPPIARLGGEGPAVHFSPGCMCALATLPCDHTQLVRARRRREARACVGGRADARDRARAHRPRG